MTGVRRLVACLATFLMLGLMAATAMADTNSAVLDKLATADVYISDQAYGHNGVHPGDLKRLQSMVDSANARNVPEKIAILAHVPANIRTPQMAADSIRTYEDFSGVVVVVYPAGIGVSSDTLTLSEDAEVATHAHAACATSGYTACALAAAEASVPLVRADEDNAFHSALVTWGIVLAVLAVVIAGAVIVYQRRSRALLARYGELPTLAGELEAARASRPPESSDSPPQGTAGSTG